MPMTAVEGKEPEKKQSPLVRCADCLFYHRCGLAVLTGQKRCDAYRDADDPRIEEWRAEEVIDLDDEESEERR
jgi:hypothetical protein